MIRRVWSLVTGSSLGVRLGATLMLALMPLGVLSMVQTRDALDQVNATTLAGVGGAALQAVRDQIEIINEAQITVRVLASVFSSERASDISCVDRVTAVAQEIPQATLVAYIPISGLMTCSSNNRVYDFRDEARFKLLIESPKPRITYNPHGPVSGTAVIGVSHPVFDSTGTQIGVVAISLSYTSVAPDDYVDSVDLWQPSYLATFLSDGSLLLSSDPALTPSDVIPEATDLKQLVRLADRPTYVDHGTGRSILSVIGVTDDLYLLSV